MTSWVNQLTHLSFCLFFPCSSSSSRITDCNVQSSEWILSNLRTNTAAMSDFSFGEHLFQSYHGKFFPDSQFSCIFIYYLIILAFQYNSRISSKGFFDFVYSPPDSLKSCMPACMKHAVWVVAYVTVCMWKLRIIFFNKPQLAHMVPVSTTRLVSVIPHSVYWSCPSINRPTQQ